MVEVRAVAREVVEDEEEEGECNGRCDSVVKDLVGGLDRFRDEDDGEDPVEDVVGCRPEREMLQGWGAKERHVSNGFTRWGKSVGWVHQPGRRTVDCGTGWRVQDKQCDNTRTLRKNQLSFLYCSSLF